MPCIDGLAPSTTSVPEMTQMTQTRVPIRDRAHACAMARQLPFGELFRDGGSVDGFADWLYMNRRTFNGRNPLQQAKVYASYYRYAARRGNDLDAQCRKAADQKEQASERADAEVRVMRATVRAWWSETPVGADITLAVVELCLSHRSRTTESLGGTSPFEPQPSWVLEWLLDVLEAFGGTDDSIDELERLFGSAEDNLRRCVDKDGKALTTVRERIFRGDKIRDLDFATITRCAWYLSCVPSIRTSLRAQLVQAEMIERVQAAAPTAPDAPPPSRRRRQV
jgi:hypothetical protein